MSIDAPTTLQALPRDKWKWWYLGALFIVCLAGPIGMFVATSDCPGMTADSRTYLMEAESVRRGKGVMTFDRDGRTHAQAQYPPMYSIMIAAGSVATKNLHAVARMLNCVFYFGTIALTAGIVRISRVGRTQNTSRVLALAAAGMIAVSSESLQIFAMIWSEGAFMFFALFAIFLLCLALRLEVRKKKFAWLFAASAASAAIAFGTRYSGACLIPPAMLVLLIDRKSTLRANIVRACLFAVIASCICGPWVIRNSLRDKSLANRSIALHHPGPQIWQSGATTVTGWFTYGWKGNPNLFGGSVLLLLLIAAIAGRVKARDAMRKWFDPSDLPFLFVATYIPFLAFTLVAVDAYMPLDRRILFPLFVALIITIASWASVWNWPTRSLLLRVGIAIFTIALITLQAVRGVQWIGNAPTKWLGYGTRQWTHSVLIARVRTLPASRLIFSNAEDAIYLHTGIIVKALPGKFEASAMVKDKKYAAKMADLRAHIQRRKAFVVYFRSVKRSYQASEKELERILKLVVVQSDKYGVIMKSADNHPATTSSTTKPTTRKR